MARIWHANLRELLFGYTAGDVELEEARMATDPEHAYYNYRFSHHRAEGDLVADPGFLWSSKAYWKARGGLAAHLLSEARVLEGMVYSDILVILSFEDWKQTHARMITAWDEQARAILSEQYAHLCDREGLEPIHPTRGFQVRFTHSEDQTLGGLGLELAPGEFLTGLAPHLYLGPVASSQVLAEVYLRFPCWQGEFRKVGALYSDQLGFTVGGHWLDSYQDPQIQEPALYQLHHFPGSDRLEHRLNLDLHERYRLGEPAEGPGGEELLPLLQRKDGATLFEVMLVRLEVEAPGTDAAKASPEAAAKASPEAAAKANAEAAAKANAEGAAKANAEGAAEAAGATDDSKGDPPARRSVPAPLEKGGRPARRFQHLAGEGLGEGAAWRSEHPLAVPSALEEAAVARADRTLPGEAALGTRLTLGGDQRLGARTIVPELLDVQSIKLSERGVLIQKIHFPELMEGYTIALGQTGHIGMRVHHPFARLRVVADALSLEVVMPGVFLDGEGIAVGKRRPLEGSHHRIGFGRTTFEVHALANPENPHWPYLAEVRRPPLTRALRAGRRYRIGRNRETCQVVLPDHPEQHNILWHPDLGEEAQVSGARGAIQRSQIYTDSIMVAGEHLDLAYSGPVPMVTNLSRSCHGFVRRGEEILPLKPASKDHSPSLPLSSGDELLVGNSLFKLTFEEEGRKGMGASSRAKLGGGTVDLVEAFPGGDAASSARSSVSASAAPVVPAPMSAPATPSLPLVDSGTPAAPPREGRDAYAGAQTVSMGQSPAVADPSDGKEASSAHSDPRLSHSSHRTGHPPPLDAAQARAVLESPGSHRTVVFRDEGEWSRELHRPGRLQLQGWWIAGRVTIGNHRDADIILLENRVDETQVFVAQDYFTAYIRGERSLIERVAGSQGRLKVEGMIRERTEQRKGLRLEVERRDPMGDVDFTLTLTFPEEAPPLPRSRARFLALDLEPSWQGLFAWGLSAQSARVLALDGMQLTVRWTEGGALITDYLETYRHQEGTYAEAYWYDGADHHTLPEDGSSLTLPVGALLIIGRQVYRVEG